MSVRAVGAQLIVAMGKAGYLSFPGGRELVFFVIRQCAMSEGEKAAFNKAADKDEPLPLPAVDAGPTLLTARNGLYGGSTSAHRTQAGYHASMRGAGGQSHSGCECV